MTKDPNTWHNFINKSKYLPNRIDTVFFNNIEINNDYADIAYKELMDTEKIYDNKKSKTIYTQLQTTSKIDKKENPFNHLLERKRSLGFKAKGAITILARIIFFCEKTSITSKMENNSPKHIQKCQNIT